MEWRRTTPAQKAGVLVPGVTELAMTPKSVTEIE
jgi:hypothetical protein